MRLLVNMLCLPFGEVNKIKKAIREGKIHPDALNNMTSQERRSSLSLFVSKENAKLINLLFEKKLLLKNQEKAMYDWAREITGLSKEQKEATLDKIKETYAEKKRRLENPRENEVFLNEIVSDIYSRKFKTEVTLEEAQTITELSQDLISKKEKLGDLNNWKTEDFDFTGTKQDAIDFGASEKALKNYMGGLKLDAQKDLLIKPSQIKNAEDFINALKQNARISFNFIADNSRAIVASVDNSFFGRQGIKVLYTKPKVWTKAFAQSWVDIANIIKSKNPNITGSLIEDGVISEIYSRKNYMKGRYELGKKLDIGTGEEEFPTSLPAKIPVLGRLFQAAETAYVSGAMRIRADVADKVYNLAEQTGTDMTNKQEVGAINDMVNSLTGRGHLGTLEKIAPMTNKVFFSIKFFKANLDTLTKGFTAETSFARKQASINLLKIASSIAVILAIASALFPDSVELDPRSANFGKIKIGNKRFDITGGMSSMVILASRILSQSTKSSVTGIITPFGSKYGSPTGMDTLWGFTENKFSPMYSVIKELIDQKTFEGEKPTFINQLENLTVPIVIEEGFNTAEKEGLANALLVVIADGIGISANTYSYNTNWDVNPGKELTQLKEKVGDKTFKEANKEYIKEVNIKIVELKQDKKWSGLDDEEKQKELTKEKNKIKNDIFRKYHFRYRK